MQDAFQLKLGLIENEKNAALSHLQQEKTQNDEKSKQLKEKLAKLEADLNRIADNDLNYDSPEDDDGNNDINYD
jgi:DNA-directed RNA polymerase subunit F